MMKKKKRTMARRRTTARRATKKTRPMMTTKRSKIVANKSVSIYQAQELAPTKYILAIQTYLTNPECLAFNTKTKMMMMKTMRL